MRKGCFISVIVFLTILMIGVFYLVKYHGEDLVEVGKVKLVELAKDQILSDISLLDDTKYNDSLKVVIEDYFSNIDDLDIKEELERIEEFSDDFEVILMDSKVDSAEFEFITNILVKYDKRKEN